MSSEVITINKEELYQLIKRAVREELERIEEISDKEQEELDSIHGKVPQNKSIDSSNYAEL